ncbi:hypothetical protein Pelo_9527 [Pelomyxa schiedti]|nr:hypothetical protein Pelo_9527 [Pelomyxa schiedti]
MSGWSPSPDVVVQVNEFLRDTLDPTKQETVRVQHERLGRLPDWSNFLLLALHSADQPQVIREVAALLLKNAMLHVPATSPAMAAIKTAILPLIADSSLAVRRAVANVITVLVGRLPRSFLDWPELLPYVTCLICDSNVHCVEGGLYLLHILCEDHTSSFDNGAMGKPILTIFPLLVKSLESTHEPFRYYSLMCIYEFIASMPDTVGERIDSLMQNLVMLTVDKSLRVKLALCKIFGCLAELHSECLLPHMPTVVSYMLTCTDDLDEEIGLEACEFWLLIFSSDTCAESLRPYLTQILQLLPKKMVLTDANALDLESSEYDSNSEWTIRKSAVAALDSVAFYFKDLCLPVLLPIASGLLKSDKWQFVECGILILGAISEGCKQGVLLHISDLSAFLTAQLFHPQIHVRSTTCWTLSRYAVSLLSLGEQIVQPILAGIITCINNDLSQTVRDSACRSITHVAEKLIDQDLQMPYINSVLSGLMLALSQKNGEGYPLYEAISAVVDCACDAVAASPVLQSLLLTPLGTKWHSLPDDNTELAPLMECFTAIVAAMGQTFAPYAPSLVGRCSGLISNTLTSGMNLEALEMALNLLCSIFQVMREPIVPLFRQFNIPPLLCACLAKRNIHFPSLLESCFALFGELFFFCVPDIAPSLSFIMPVLLESINPDLVTVCTHACFALSETVIHYHENFQVWGPVLIGNLIAIQSNCKAHRSLLRNSAVLLCQICFIAPTSATNLMTPEHLRDLCVLIRKKAGRHRDTVLIGLCSLFRHNSASSVSVLPYFCDSVLSNQPSPQVKQMLLDTLVQIHTLIGAQNWANVLSSFPASLKEALLSLGLP